MAICSLSNMTPFERHLSTSPIMFWTQLNAGDGKLSQLETASRITPKTGIECPNGPLHLQWPKMAVLSQALAFAEDWISSRTAWNATRVRRNATSKQQIARMQRPTTKGTKTLGHA